MSVLPSCPEVSRAGESTRDDESHLECDSIALRKPQSAGLLLRFGILTLTALSVSTAGLALGAVSVPLHEVVDSLLGRPVDPVSETILHDIRWPRTITALLVGASLGVTGLQMQTLFRNPLADPYVLGLSSGASLGVGVVILLAGTSAQAASLTAGLGLTGDLGLILAAGLGSGLVMCLVLLAGRFLRSSTTLLLLGVMLGYLVSAAVTVMLAGATPELIAQYTRWGFGSYHGVTWSNLGVLAPALAFTLALSMLLAKWLNALLLGDNYAQTMGINLRLARASIVLSSALLAGGATAFCGPIGFLGIAVPHLCRGLFASSDHRVLLPGCALVGCQLALAADILAQLPGENVLPLNAVNAAFGAPVVIYILLRRHRGLGA